MTFRTALDKALSITGRSLRDVANSAGVSYEQLKSLRQGKSRSTNVDDAVKVASAFGVSLDTFLAGSVASAPRHVPILGKVGAGAQVPVLEAYEVGGAPSVIIPDALLSKASVAAVQIEGDSMEPVYSDGDLLFFSRPSHDGVPVETIGKRCVCETDDGLGWVKQVKLGSTTGLFNLISLNPTAANQHDVRLRWAAAVELHWPKTLARLA